MHSFRWILLLVLFVLLSGCLGYVEVLPPKETVNYAPRIIIQDPITDVITIPRDKTITFKVQVADRNLQDTLYPYWLLNPHRFPNSNYARIACNTLDIVPTSNTPEVREYVVECSILHNWLDPEELNILKFIVSDRPPLAQPIGGNNIEWSEGAQVAWWNFVVVAE